MTGGGGGGNDRAGDDRSDKPFHFTDRRRFDPKTGARREGSAGGAAPVDSSAFGPKGAPFGPGGVSGNPADPANAAQPISAEVGTPELEAAQQAVLDDARSAVAERTADLQRVTAEYANYRKRVDRDREQVTLAAKATVLTEMLTVLDDIDRADAHGDLTGAFKSVADKLSGVLTRLGLEQVGAQGDPFDPAHHDAVQFATSADVAEPTVTDVLRHGYSISGRLVRPAVVVVTGPEHEDAADSVDAADAVDVPPVAGAAGAAPATEQADGADAADAADGDNGGESAENADSDDDSTDHS
ncbi:MAG: nucleotide exchange factor GrpE [Actinomycetota bacterium]|nr:nucleotide exchange factor GrpE [Actinomycetota bacterium]